MKISPALLGKILRTPGLTPGKETCGVVAIARGTSSPSEAVAFYPATNIHASPLRFEIDGRELLALYSAIEDDGQEIGAIYHSHVRSPPYPSQTDINFAANWPGIEWIIVGLADPQAPEVRSYLIDGERVKEVPL